MTSSFGRDSVLVFQTVKLLWLRTFYIAARTKQPILSRPYQYLIWYYSFSTFHTNVQMCFISIFYLTLVNVKVGRQEKTVKATFTKKQQHCSYDEDHWATAKNRRQEVSFSTQKYQLCRTHVFPDPFIWQTVYVLTKGTFIPLEPNTKYILDGT